LQSYSNTTPLTETCIGKTHGKRSSAMIIFVLYSLHLNRNDDSATSQRKSDEGVSRKQRKVLQI
jgi:hypothetical protein